MPLFHVWFATKRRKWLLQGDILDAVREEIAFAAEHHDIRVLEQEAVVDHVHMLLELDDATRLPKAMNLIKGASARRIFQRFPELKLDAHTLSFWQAKYAFKEIPPEREQIVRRYIRTQWDRLDDYVR
jgi:putative transposase